MDIQWESRKFVSSRASSQCHDGNVVFARREECHIHGAYVSSCEHYAPPHLHLNLMSHRLMKQGRCTGRGMGVVCAFWQLLSSISPCRDIHRSLCVCTLQFSCSVSLFVSSIHNRTTIHHLETIFNKTTI